MLGWGGLPAILSGLLALLLLSCAESIARRGEHGRKRELLLRFFLLGGIGALALFVVLLIVRLMSDAAAALAM